MLLLQSCIVVPCRRPPLLPRRPATLRSCRGSRVTPPPAQKSKEQHAVLAVNVIRLKAIEERLMASGPTSTAVTPFSIQLISPWRRLRKVCFRA
ncbi:hypothetical protein ABZP36_002031 [Zizania latifolia]